MALRLDQHPPRRPVGSQPRSPPVKPSAAAQSRSRARRWKALRTSTFESWVGHGRNLLTVRQPDADDHVAQRYQRPQPGLSARYGRVVGGGPE